MNERRSRKIVVDFNVEFTSNLTPENIAAIIRDYVHLLRFTIGIAEVSVYPLNTKIVQHPLSLESNLPDTKN